MSVVSDLSDVTSVRRAAVEIAALGLPIAGLQPSSRSAISDRHVRAVTDTFELVATEEDNYPARTMCQWLVVSTSGFYDWYRRPSSSGPAGTPLWTPRHQPPPDLMMCTAPHRRLRSAPRRAVDDVGHAILRNQHKYAVRYACARAARSSDGSPRSTRTIASAAATAIAVRVSTVALPTWGRRTARGAARRRGLTAGSPS